MPSTMTQVVATRLRPNDVDKLRELAARRGLTLSALLASLARDGLHKAA